MRPGDDVASSEAAEQPSAEALAASPRASASSVAARGARSALAARPSEKRPKLSAAFAPVDQRCLVAGFRLLNVADPRWAHGIGIVCLFGFVVLAFRAIIFAVLGEELGLVGAVTVLILFLIFGWRGFRIALHAPDGFGRLVATGVTTYIVAQTLLNIAVISNTVPFTGVPLPFISYGGASMIVTLCAIGVLLNISRLPAAAVDVEPRIEDEPLPPSPPRRAEIISRSRIARVEHYRHAPTRPAPVRMKQPGTRRV